MNNPCMQRLGVLSMVVTSLAASGIAAADTLHVTDDGDIALTAPSSNFGASGTLFVRNAGTGSARNAFAQFDLSALPPDAFVSRATLRIWVSRVEDAGSLDLFAITEPWGEASLTGNTAPGLEHLGGRRRLAFGHGVEI
ncbi:MAG: DNRLRE domain-containing protein, partial [Polyangiaceae bacterium]